MRNQMQMIRVREGAVGVGQTERAITPYDTCPDSSGFCLLSGPGRKKILDLKVQLLSAGYVLINCQQLISA